MCPVRNVTYVSGRSQRLAAEPFHPTSRALSELFRLLDLASTFPICRTNQLMSVQATHRHIGIVLEERQRTP